MASSAKVQKKVYRRLSLSEKLDIIKRLEQGEKQIEIVKSLNVSKSQISRIAIGKEKLKNIEKHSIVPLKSKKAADKSKFPQLDNDVYSWFHSVLHPVGRVKCRPLPLSRDIIKSKALSIAKDLGIQNFRASDGWFRNWRWRKEIGKSVRLHGEAGEVDLDLAELQM